MLNGIAGRAAYPREAYNEVAADARREMAGEFSSQGQRGGRAWVGLASSTLERKRRESLPSRILVATGALQASLVTSGGGNITQIDHEGVAIGTTVAYARFVSGGTRRQPARPIRPSVAAQERWVDMLAEHIIEGRR